MLHSSPLCGRWAIVRVRALVVLTLLSLLVAACSAASPEPSLPPAATKAPVPGGSGGGQTAQPVPTPVEAELVTVANVVDGDTAELTDGRLVRYLGINTPERGQPYFEEARSANRRLVEGETLQMVHDLQPVDRFGRTLAYLWANGRLVNLELVRQGYASVYTEPPNVRFSQELIAAEREARQAGVGLWTPAQLPIRIKKIQYDAPGPDPDNPNGEWLEIVNEGSEAIDLTGFTVKDQANHIFTFSLVRLEPGQTLRLYSGEGQRSSTVLYWGLTRDSVWSNGGDTAYLRDAEGRLVDDYSY